MKICCFDYFEYRLAFSVIMCYFDNLRNEKKYCPVNKWETICSERKMSLLLSVCLLICFYFFFTWHFFKQVGPTHTALKYTIYSTHEVTEQSNQDFMCTPAVNPEFRNMTWNISLLVARRIKYTSLLRRNENGGFENITPRIRKWQLAIKQMQLQFITSCLWWPDTVLVTINQIIRS